MEAQAFKGFHEMSQVSPAWKNRTLALSTRPSIHVVALLLGCRLKRNKVDELVLHQPYASCQKTNVEVTFLELRAHQEHLKQLTKFACQGHQRLDPAKNYCSLKNRNHTQPHCNLITDYTSRSVNRPPLSPCTQQKLEHRRTPPLAAQSMTFPQYSAPT